MHTQLIISLYYLLYLYTHQIVAINDTIGYRFLECYQIFDIIDWEVTYDVIQNFSVFNFPRKDSCL